ncbi:MAG: tetratricopeptide repeat protein [bacterium]|nr:tetratricopeptide repeat protein [bacterium]
MICWLEGHCLSYGKSIPYWPFLEIVKSYLEITESDNEAQIKDKLTSCLASLFGERSNELIPYLCTFLSLKLDNKYIDKVKYLNSETLKLEVFVSLRDLFITISKKCPLILVLEDLHWIDTASLDLLEFLLNGVISAPFLIISLFRSKKEGSCVHLMECAKKRIPDNYVEINLTPLPEDDNNGLINNLLDIPSVPDSLKKLILDKSEGNPFYVEELIRSLIDYKVLREENGLWQLTIDIKEIDVPDTVHSVIASRIDKLDDNTKQVLQTASVIGHSFLYRVLKYASDATRGDISEELDKSLNLLEDRQFILKQILVELEYLFKHILTQEVAYNSLLKKRRIELHRRVGECTEVLFKDRLDDYYGLLSWHYFKGEDWQKALDYTEKAAKQARAIYANQQEIEYYTRILSVVGIEGKLIVDTELQISVLKERSKVYTLIGQTQPALVDIDEALLIANKTNNRKTEADCLTHKAIIFTALSKYEESLKLARSALDIYIELKCEKGKAESLNRIGIAYFHLGNSVEALNYFQQSLKISREICDRQNEAYSLNNIGAVYYNLGEYNEALNYFQQSLKIRPEIGDRQGEANCLNNIGIIYFNLSDYKGAFTYYQQSLKISQQIGDRVNEAMAFNNIGNIYDNLSNYKEALTCYQQSLMISQQIGNRAGEALAFNNIGTVYSLLGNYKKALIYFQQSLKIYQETGGKRGEADSIMEIGGMYQDLGNYKEALSYFQQSLKLFEQIGAKGGIASTLIMMIQAHIGKSDLGSAKALKQKVEKTVAELKSIKPMLDLRLAESKLYELDGDFKNAIGFAEEVLNKAIELGEQMSEATACLRLCKILAKSNKKEEIAKIENYAKRMIEIGSKTESLPIMWKGYWFMYECSGKKEWLNELKECLYKQFPQIPEEHLSSFKSYVQTYIGKMLDSKL